MCSKTSVAKAQFGIIAKILKFSKSALRISAWKTLFFAFSHNLGEDHKQPIFYPYMKQDGNSSKFLIHNQSRLRFHYL